MTRSLFPGQPTAEQHRRYKEIQAILNRYAKGEATIKEVLAIPEDELAEMQAWVHHMSLGLLEKDIPEIWDGVSE